MSHAWHEVCLVSSCTPLARTGWAWLLRRECLQCARKVLVANVCHAHEKSCSKQLDADHVLMPLAGSCVRRTMMLGWMIRCESTLLRFLCSLADRSLVKMPCNLTVPSPRPELPDCLGAKRCLPKRQDVPGAASDLWCRQAGGMGHRQSHREERVILERGGPPCACTSTARLPVTARVGKRAQCRCMDFAHECAIFRRHCMSAARSATRWHNAQGFGRKTMTPLLRGRCRFVCGRMQRDVRAHGLKGQGTIR